MTINSYKTLYKSAISFGQRKHTESLQGKKEINDEQEELQKQKEDLENTRNELLKKKKAIQRKIEERRNQEQIKRKQEIDFLNYQNEHLRQFFYSIENK